MTKAAETEHPIHSLLVQRWSPYAFGDRPVEPDDLRALFEAARWAPSSYNEQPWRYILATRDDTAHFERVLSCLVEPNQVWAKHAPVLVLGATRRRFERNGKPNAACEHDLGLAAACLTFEAMSRGIYVHQMIGVLPDRARELFHLPDDTDVLTALAIGYPDTEGAPLPEEILARDSAPRSRNPVREFVYGPVWGEAAPLLKEG